MSLDLSTFKPFRKSSSRYAIASNGITIGKAMCIGSDTVEWLKSKGSFDLEKRAVYVAFSYSEEFKALQLDVLEDRKLCWAFSLDRGKGMMNGTAWASTPAALKAVPMGHYQAHPDHDGIYVRDESSIRSRDDSLILNEFETIEVGDIVHWSFRREKPNQKTLVATGRVLQFMHSTTALDESGNPVCLAKVQPIGKNYLDYRNVKEVTVKLDLLLLREKA